MFKNFFYFVFYIALAFFISFGIFKFANFWGANFDITLMVFLITIVIIILLYLAYYLLPFNFSKSAIIVGALALIWPVWWIFIENIVANKRLLLKAHYITETFNPFWCQDWFKGLIEGGLVAVFFLIVLLED